MSVRREAIARIYVDLLKQALEVEPCITDPTDPRAGSEPSILKLIEFYYKTAGGGACADKAEEYVAKYVDYICAHVKGLA